MPNTTSPPSAAKTSPSTFPLLHLPPELLLQICTHLPTFHDLASLSLTTRYLHALLNRHLYRTAVTSLSQYVPPYRFHAPCTLPPWPSTKPLSVIYNSFRSIAGWALLHGPLGTLENLVRCGMAVDARFVHWWGDISNATLLMVAVLHKREGVVRWLLEMGASCGATDEIGWKAVHYVLEDPVEERSKEVLLGKRLVLYEGKWESGVVEREGVRVYVLEGRMFRIAVMLNEYYRNNGAKVRV